MGMSTVAVVVTVLPGNGRIVVVVTVLEIVIAPPPTVGRGVIINVAVDVMVVRGMGG